MTAQRHRTRPQQRRPRGYVLLFCLGVLAVVSALLLMAAKPLRLQAQLVAQQRDTAQAEAAMRGAAQWALTQWWITRTVDALQAQQADEALGRLDLWRLGQPPRPVAVGDRSFEVSIADGAWWPDMNQLTGDEWLRLLQTFGGLQPADAVALHDRIQARRIAAARSSGTAGFASVRTLDTVPGMPLSLIESPPPLPPTDERSGPRADPSAVPAALGDLLGVQTRNRAVHLDYSPLQVFRIIGGASPEQLRRLQQLRERGPVSRAQAEELFADIPYEYLTAESGLVRVTVREPIASLPPGVRARSWVAIFAPEPAGYRLVAQWPGR